jgi:hypothetical protein
MFNAADPFANRPEAIKKSEERRDNLSLVKEVEKTSQMKSEEIVLKIDKYVDAQNEKLKDLVERKQAIQSSPMEKNEYCEFVLEELRDTREKIFNDILTPALVAGHKGGLFPFPAGQMKGMFFHPNNVWKAGYAALTDEDIKAVCATLPDDGVMTEKEKAKALAAIQQEIEAVMEKLENPPIKEILGLE